MGLSAIVLLGTLTALAQAPANTSSMDLAGFVDDMNRLTNAIGRAQPREVAKILTTMPHAYRVREGQQEFDVPFERFAQRLDAARHPNADWTSERQRLIDDLRFVRDEAAALQAGHARQFDPRPTLTAILSRREFSVLRLPDWRAELRQRIVAWLNRMWRSLGGDRVNSRTTALVLASLAIIIGTASLAVWLVRRGAPRSGRTRTGLDPAPAVSSRAWALRAIAAARTGETRAAARCAYRAALRRLEEQGIWQIDESRTAREYLRLLQPGGTNREVFGSLVQRFEMAWFARRTLTRDDLIVVGDSLERLGCLSPHERAI